MNMDLKKLKIILTWIFTIGIFLIIFSRIKLSGVIDAVMRADVMLLSLSLIISGLAHILFIPARYKDILRTLGCRLSFSEIFILRLGSIPIKGVLPFKTGELSKVVYLKKVHNLSYSKGTGSVFMEYGLSIFALSLFILIGLNLFFLALILLMLMFIARIVLHRKEWSKTIIAAFFYSLCFEACKLLDALLIFRAVNVGIPYQTFLVFTPMIFLIASVPITFWGLGTRESAVLLIFANYAAAQNLLGSSLLISFVNHIFPIFLGLLFLKPFLNRLLTVKQKGV